MQFAVKSSVTSCCSALMPGGSKTMRLLGASSFCKCSSFSQFSVRQEVIANVDGHEALEHRDGRDRCELVARDVKHLQRRKLRERLWQRLHHGN